MESRFIELSDGVIIKCYDLTLQEFDLLKEEKGVDSMVANISHEYSMYKLHDGTVVIADNVSAILYVNKEEAELVIQEHEKKYHGEGVHILQGKNIYGPHFALHSNDLINQLKADLDLDYKLGDAELLNIIDRKIHSLKNSIEFYISHYLNLIALIGEVLIQEEGVEWYMIFDSDNNIWEPYIVKFDKRAEFFTFLWEDISQRQDSNMPMVKEVYSTIKEIIQR